MMYYRKKYSYLFVFLIHLVSEFKYVTIINSCLKSTFSIGRVLERIQNVKEIILMFLFSNKNVVIHFALIQQINVPLRKHTYI